MILATLSSAFSLELDKFYKADILDREALDEIFDKGYTEETDYQFKAESYGFKAKVLIDSYVFHECRVSFGESKKQLSIRDEHLKIFFDRWGEQYQKKMNIYKKHDPIEYI